MALHPELLMPDAQTPSRKPPLSLKAWLAKAVVFLSVTVLLGWFYGWASPRFFPKDKSAGLGLGIIHGALMPMALPSLLMGQDVDIYQTRNTGRPYKLGYIAGINACGLIFFGAAFWRPPVPAAKSAGA